MSEIPLGQQCVHVLLSQNCDLNSLLFQCYKTFMNVPHQLYLLAMLLLMVLYGWDDNFRGIIFQIDPFCVMSQKFKKDKTIYRTLCIKG